LRLVVDRCPDTHLDIAGEDTLRGAIHDLACERGLGSHVTFHGFRPTDAIVPLYRTAHLFVLSSRHEAAGVVVLEAAASGVPAVGSSVGYIADWTPSRAVGVAPADAPALADAIVALLRDPPRRRRLAVAAREWTLAHDADWTAREFERVYREVARSLA
jgi:glycosyltransferase involved in cell wall biosynthesis